MRAPVAPTAASAWLPENLPTTIISAALNSSCRMFIAIIGSANIKIFENSGPLHMSMSRFREAIGLIASFVSYHTRVSPIVKIHLTHSFSRFCEAE